MRSKNVASNVLVMLLASLYVLLAMQAEPVTKTLGFIAAAILVLAIVAQTMKQRAE